MLDPKWILTAPKYRGAFRPMVVNWWVVWGHSCVWGCLEISGDVIYFLIFILFIWLLGVLVVAHTIFDVLCGMWDLLIIPRPGIQPGRHVL